MLRAEFALASGQDQRILELKPDDHVYHLLGLRLADGSPLSLESSRLPAAMFPHLLLEDLSSLYALLRAHYDVAPEYSDENLEPVLADDEQARPLEVASGTPLIHLHRSTIGPGGRPIEIGREHFVGTGVRFRLRKHGSVRRSAVGLGERPDAGAGITDRLRSFVQVQTRTNPRCFRRPTFDRERVCRRAAG